MDFNDGPPADSGPRNAHDPFFGQLEQLTLEWARTNPRSSLAHLLHASALSNHAWSYRGHGMAREVPPQAWKNFETYIQRSIVYLSDHGEVAMGTSSAHANLINLGRAAGWDPDRLWAVAAAGLAKNPEDDRVMEAMLDSVLPKWGGSAVLVDRLVLDLVERTRAAHGEIFYARAYTWAADAEFSHRLFADSAASWPRMKAGFQQLVLKHPEPVNFNSFARFACQARDKPQLLQLLEGLGDKPILPMWGQNAARTYETCKRWAAEQ